MILNKGQAKASKKGIEWYKHSSKQVFSIVGPAGSGKTTIIFSIIDALGLKLDEVLFVVYTGKACLPMINNGLNARTVHSACYTRKVFNVYDDDHNLITLTNGRFKKVGKFVLKEQLPSKIKLIVLDEARSLA